MSHIVIDKVVFCGKIVRMLHKERIVTQYPVTDKFNKFKDNHFWFCTHKQKCLEMKIPNFPNSEQIRKMKDIQQCQRTMLKATSENVSSNKVWELSQFIIEIFFRVLVQKPVLLHNLHLFLHSPATEFDFSNLFVEWNHVLLRINFGYFTIVYCTVNIGLITKQLMRNFLFSLFIHKSGMSVHQCTPLLVKASNR